MKIIGKIKLYNAHFREARLSAGFKTVKSLADFTNISASMLCAYEGLKAIPKCQRHIETLVSALGQEIDILFPSDVCVAIAKDLGKTFWFEKSVDLSAIEWANPLLLEYNPLENAIKVDEKENIQRLIKTLTPREQDVLKKRYYEDMSYRAIGKSLKNALTGKKGLSNSMASVIENRALRKLRCRIIEGEKI